MKNTHSRFFLEHGSMHIEANLQIKPAEKLLSFEGQYNSHNLRVRAENKRVEIYTLGPGHRNIVSAGMDGKAAFRVDMNINIGDYADKLVVIVDKKRLLVVGENYGVIADMQVENDAAKGSILGHKVSFELSGTLLKFSVDGPLATVQGHAGEQAGMRDARVVGVVAGKVLNIRTDNGLLKADIDGLDPIEVPFAQYA
jgi:hypothetical protein